MIGGWLLDRLSARARRRGDRARDRQEWTVAATHYRRYLAVMPGNFAIWVQLGHVTAEAGDLVAAENAYRTASELADEDADLLLCWGHLRKRRGDLEGARALYARSSAVDGNHDALRELTSLSAPAQLPAAVSGAVYAGRVHRAEGRALVMVVSAPAGAGSASVELRADGRVVGRAYLDKAWREGEGYAAKMLADVGEDAMVSAFRMPDGAELDNSPIQVTVPRPAAVPRRAWDAQLEIVKPLVLPSDPGEIALLFVPSRSGALPPHAIAYLGALQADGIAVLLIAVGNSPMRLPADLVDGVAGAIIRRDEGGAFAAWAHALKLYPDIYAGTLLYLLDATNVVLANDRLSPIIRRVRDNRADLIGLTESHAGRWHLESYFLALKPRLLSSFQLHRFFRELDPADSANAEQYFTSEMDYCGHSIAVLFASPFAGDPMGRGWDGLAAAGFPFAPLSQSISPDADPIGDRAALRTAGFDADLIAAARRAADEEVPRDPAGHLAVHRVRNDDHPDVPLKVAFLGPWNDGGEAGAVARRLICAMRRAGVQLNLYAANGSTEKDGPIGPSVDVLDFGVPADIAIVQIAGGKSWWSSEAQRDVVRAARRRIGWWPAPQREQAIWPSELPPMDRLWMSDPDQVARLSIRDDAPIELLPEDAGDRQIEERLRAALRGRGAGPRIERLVPRLLAGVALEQAALGEDFRIVALSPDGALMEEAAAVLAEDERARARWIVFAPAGSLIAPLFARTVREQAHRRPDVAIFYGDDVAVATEHPIDQIRLKPDFDPILLAAQDYVGAPVIVRDDALEALGGLRPERRTAALADLLFRADAAGLTIARIPEVLLAHPGERIRAAVADYAGMLAAQPALRDYVISPGRALASFALARPFASADAPPVTIIVPTRRSALRSGSGSYIEQLLAGLAKTDWPMEKLTVLIGDDIPGPPEWAGAAWPFTLRLVETPRPSGERFNYAAKMNRLWRVTRTEQIVFLNDDVVPCDGGWLKALQTFAVDDRVGGVGARLLFEEGTLQHAGLAPHGYGAGHVWVYRRRAQGTYHDWAQVHRQWSMVTGAVFATRRTLMEQVGGFDEQFPLEFNDSDLCLRLRSLGYRMVCTPHAEMIHAEKVSRGEALPRGNEVAHFLGRWKPWIDHDPAWHPGLRLDRIDMTPLVDDCAWYI